MNETGLPQAITAASILVAAFVVGNMIFRIGNSGKKRRRNKKRKPLP
jgi:hypothetical protein